MLPCETQKKGGRSGSLFLITQDGDLTGGTFAIPGFVTSCTLYRDSILI